MSVPIRIDDELYEEAKRSAAAESRTVPLQIAYWAKIGKASLDNPDLPGAMIRDILRQNSGAGSCLSEFDEE